MSSAPGSRVSGNGSRKRSGARLTGIPARELKAGKEEQEEVTRVTLAEQRRSYGGQGSDMHRGPLRGTQRLTESLEGPRGARGH